MLVVQTIPAKHSSEHGMVNGLGVVQIIMNIGGDDEGAIARDRASSGYVLSMGGTISSITEQHRYSSAPSFRRCASGRRGRDDGAAVRTVEILASRTYLETSAAADATSSLRLRLAPGALRRRSHFFNGDLRRDGILVAQQGGRQRRRAERDGVTIISRRRRRRRHRRQRRRRRDRWRRRRRRSRRLARDELQISTLGLDDAAAVQRHIIIRPLRISRGGTPRQNRNCRPCSARARPAPTAAAPRRRPAFVFVSPAPPGLAGAAPCLV